MPVELTKPLRLKFHDSSSNSSGDGKVPGIDLPEGTPLSRNRFRGMIICVEDIGAVALQSSLRSFLEVLTDSAVEDVREFRGTVIEYGRVNTKVLRENVSGGVGNPVVDHEGCSYSLLACDSHEMVWEGRCTRSFQSRRRQRQVDTRSHRPNLGHYEQRPWGSTRYLPFRASQW